MKTHRIIIVFGIILLSGTMIAQIPDNTEVQESANNIISSWINKNPPDWTRGILLAFLGFAGALFTVFGFIGGAIPGTAGQVRIEKDEATLDLWSEQLGQLITHHSDKTNTISALQTAVNNLRDDVRKDKWSQFMIAALLYVFLGFVFAALLADDWLEALIIGAGWTGIVGAMGLKKDQAERKTIKDKSNNELREVNRVLLEKLTQKSQSPAMSKRESGLAETFEKTYPGVGTEQTMLDTEIKEWIEKVNTNSKIANRL